MRKIILLAALAPLAFGFSFDLDSANAPVTGSTNLGYATSSLSLKLENNSPITGADYDETTKKWALCSRYNEFYTTSEDFSSFSYAKHDRHFIMEMEDTVGATWYKGEVGMLSYNKTFISYTPASALSEDEQRDGWRHLLEGWDKFKLNDFGNKNRFFTIRAKQQYVLGWDYDASLNAFVSASVPNDVRPSWSVAVFDADDKMPLAEFVPSLSEPLALKEGRSLGEYYITGVDSQNGRAYLLSKNYSSILSLNLNNKKIDEIYTFLGVTNPRALAVKDGKFYVFSREGEDNKVFIFNIPTKPASVPEINVQESKQEL